MWLGGVGPRAARAGARVPASRTVAPVDDLGLVDLEAAVAGGEVAEGGARRALDVDHAPAGAADQVVVVLVTHPGLVARR